MKKVLFIGMHRFDRSPSQRYRFEQYFSFLKDNGFDCELSSLISAKDDKMLYSPGHYLGKAMIFLKSSIIRLKDALRAKNYDLIFIQREAFMTGTILFERLLKRSGIPIIYDYDDAIWMKDENPANRSLGFLKRPDKTAELIALSTHIIAGNDYLADYARIYNNNISVIPTTIDTDRYTKTTKEASGQICIGWTGSFTTVKHFETIVPVLKNIKEKYEEKVRFKLIGDSNYINDDLDIQGLPWKSETEAEDLSDIDIGIMPLPDDEWSKGKCGLKGLQYMALGIPTVMADVGVNIEIIHNGVNGMLASSSDDWETCLNRLIESSELRKSLGSAGRKTVVQSFSVEANKEKYLELFQSLTR